MNAPQIQFLPDGRRMHLHHGPIDLIVDATGPGRDRAFRAAATRFETILQELVDELEVLRQPVTESPVLTGPVARSMLRAATEYSPLFVTPMAGVAGAVADEIIRAMVASGPLETAYVNNGGDVAFHIAEGHQMVAAIAGAQNNRAVIPYVSPVRGVATSGWRGRSYSLGIADSVTVLAPTAVQADVAATMIANHVDLPGHPLVRREPANVRSPDSDLGDRLVTLDVGPISFAEASFALDQGEKFARRCLEQGRICAALLSLRGVSRVVGDFSQTEYLKKEDCYA